MFFYNLKGQKDNRSIALLLFSILFITPYIIHVFVISNMNISSPASYNDEKHTFQEHSLVASNPILVEEEKEEIVFPLIQSMTGHAQSMDYTPNSYDASFFENSVFVGDSISVGFENYCLSHDNSILTDSTYFLARVSCSAKAVVSDRATTIHANVVPMYNGKVQLIEDSISQIGSIEKVFICFGVNDLVGCSPEEYISNIQILVDRILEKNPDVTIYMISIPCVCENVSTGYLNNIAIFDANTLLQETCIVNHWGFINLTEYIMNENYALQDGFTSDGYVHENTAAYDIWTNILKNYANEGNIS